jgi:hypothetical protein
MKMELRKLFSDRPETVWPLPDWMLPSERVYELKREPSLAVTEIAGRDSIAAAFLAAGTDRFSALLPTIAFTGTEYGDWTAPFRAVRKLEALVGGAVKVYSPVVVGAPAFWKELCGSPNYRVQEEFGFYSPCAGCHLYFHALRIPLALELGSSVIIAGERTSHDGRKKLSQTGISLEAWNGFCRSFGIELFMPLKEISSGAEVEKIFGKEEYGSSEQLECVLSGNYLGQDGRAVIEEEKLKRFLDRFALPLAERWVRKKIPSTVA